MIRLLFGMRARTTIIAVLAAAAAFAGVSVALLSVLRASLFDEVDRSLQARAIFIDAQVGDPRVGNKVITSARRRDAGKDTLELLLGPRGQFAAASDKTGDGKQILDRLPDEEGPFTADLSSFEETEGSDNMRVLAVVDDPDIPQLGRIVTATSLNDVDEVGLIVDDDGSGIARKDRNRVFERYARVDEGRSTKEGGSGLGLAICREIANRHGGSIAIEDAEIGGARFIVTLPAAERS